MLRDLYRYRHFIVSSIRSELFGRFIRSKLGGLWMILHPLAQVAIYALILSNVLSAKLPGIESKYAYAIYLMAGLLAWNLFSEVLGRCLNLFLEQADLLKKVHFPRITLPVIVSGFCLTNNILLLVSMIGIFLLLGHKFSLVMVWVVPLIGFTLAVSLGLGIMLGVLNVFVRDVGQVVPIVLQIWFWLTPIVYPVSIIPEPLLEVLEYNPMYHIVEAFHGALVYGASPSMELIGALAFSAAVLLLISLALFRRANEEIADVL